MVDMADAPDVEREINATNGALHDLRGSIDGLVKQLKARDGVFNITGAPQSTHVRMVAKRLVFSVSAACSLTIRIGALSFVYDTATALTIDLPAPITIVDRGVDIFATVSGGAALRIAYLTYGPE